MNSKDDKTSPPAASGSKRSGRVSHDARGNPVWEWQISTGVFEKDVTTKSLKKLEAPGLSLMDTQAVVKDKTKEKEKANPQPKVTEPLPGGGMNPYDSGGLRPAAKPREQFDTSKLHPALAHKQQTMRKEPPRQSIQTKYQDKSPAKPKGLMDKLRSALRGK